MRALVELHTSALAAPVVFDMVVKTIGRRAETVAVQMDMTVGGVPKIEHLLAQQKQAMPFAPSVGLV
jgi:hypothetical protein